MAIINQRWPRDVCPESCVFGRTRNDVRQTSVRTRKATIIKQGRPLWRAECSWSLPNTKRLAKLRYWLERLDGYSGSVQLWDFANPFPFGLELAVNSAGYGEIRTTWTYASAASFWTKGSVPSHWSVAAAVVTTSALTVGSTSVPVSGLEPNKVATVQGQYVQIGRRLYLAASDVISSPSGTATIELQSGLLTSPGSGATVRLAEAACEMQLVDQNIDARSRAGDGLTVISATFLESVEDVS